MTERNFYKLMDFVEKAEVPTGMGSYYPTVEELKISMQGYDTERFMPVLLYFASNPLKDVKDAAYVETVKYCKQITSNVRLMRD